jgi:hypothetical protein
MADHGNMDIKQHKGTYDGIMALLKWGTAACVFVGAVVILLISN